VDGKLRRGKMGEDILAIREYEGEGYKALIDFKSWRVAILRWAAFMAVEKLDSMERHTQTDEVFVLLSGCASIVLGGNGIRVDEVQMQEMEVGKLYNVRQNAWHAAIMSQDASILIVEESDTWEGNTEYCQLNDGLRQEIRVIAGRRSRSL
jgi:mannose-6-phosphate isomerase-like protein (cupin superfamily)